MRAGGARQGATRAHSARGATAACLVSAPSPTGLRQPAPSSHSAGRRGRDRMAGPLPTSINLLPFAGTSLSHWEIKCFFPPGERLPHPPGWANCSDCERGPVQRVRRALPGGGGDIHGPQEPRSSSGETLRRNWAMGLRTLGALIKLVFPQGGNLLFKNKQDFLHLPTLKK